MIFKIIFISLLVIVFLISFYCAVSIYWHKRFEKKCDQSKYLVSSLGYNIAVSGPKGSGKSTTCAAFAHIITMYYIWKIRTTLNSIRKKLYFLNFNFIEQSFIYFLNELSLLESPPSKTWYYDEAIEKTVTLVLSAYKNSLNEFYINFVDIEIKRELLEDYLLNFLVLNFRRKFVVSTSGFFNRISFEH